MFKFIFLIFFVYLIIWVVASYTSSYTPISRQIDVKTMSLSNPSYLTKETDICEWTCQDYSSSSYWWSSWWWWSSSWK